MLVYRRVHTNLASGAAPSTSFQSLFSQPSSFVSVPFFRRGMVPLLFLKPAKVEIPKEDLEAGWMTTVKLRFYDSHVIHFGEPSQHLVRQACVGG